MCPRRIYILYILRIVVEQYYGKSFEPFKELPEWEFNSYLGWHEQKKNPKNLFALSFTLSYSLYLAEIQEFTQIAFCILFLKAVEHDPQALLKFELYNRENGQEQEEE